MVFNIGYYHPFTWQVLIDASSVLRPWINSGDLDELTALVDLIEDTAVHQLCKHKLDAK